MKQLMEDLWETEVERPFPGLTTHAYLLTREAGNILFYNTSHSQEIEAMAGLGGVAYQFLSHRDEVGPGMQTIRERYRAKLGGHLHELDDFAAVCEPDIVFDTRETVLGNIEVIPTPGHSPGSTCFLVEAQGGRRYLFTGDTIYFSKGKEWKAGFIPGISDREQLIQSLHLLEQLEPDLVISSAFAGPAGLQELRPEQWQRQVQAARARLEGVER